MPTDRRANPEVEGRAAILAGAHEFLSAAGFDVAAVTPLAGDLSARSYFRAATATGALLVAFYPPGHSGAGQRFVEARRLLAEAGVRVPEIAAWQSDRGYMALEDLGERTVYELACAGEPVAGYVDSAARASRAIAALDPGAVATLGNPPLDRALLERELGATFENLFEARGFADLGPRGDRFRAALSTLCEALAAEAPRPCHRDFMVRNLMPRAGFEVAVLDFQDLRLGPPGYDLASLLNDSLFAAEELERSALAQGVPLGLPADAYARSVVQRSLKAAGTFARFAAAGHRRHLPLVAPTLARAVPHLERLPETAGPFAAIAAWWSSRLLAEPFC